MTRVYASTRCVFLMLGLAAGGAYAAETAKTARYTAEYYQLNKRDLLDTEVKLYVTCLRPQEGGGAGIEVPGHRAFTAETAYRGNVGGTMTVFMPTDDSEMYVKRLGTAPKYGNNKVRAKRVMGTLKEDTRVDDSGKPLNKGALYVVVAPIGGTKAASSPERASPKRSQYPYIKNKRLYTGSGGRPVQEVIDLLRKEGEMEF